MAVLKLCVIFVLFQIASSAKYEEYKYTQEAYGTDKQQCLGNCENELCLFDDHVGKIKCKPTKALAPVYQGLQGEDCISNCVTGAASWCIIEKDLKWQYCSRMEARVGKESIKVNNHQICLDECGLRNNRSECFTIDTWIHCDPNNKIIIFNYPTNDGDTCESQCTYSENVTQCYNNQQQLVKCYLNPKKHQILTRIDEIMKSKFAPGEFVDKDFVPCKNWNPTESKDWPVIRCVQDLINYYESEFPSMVPTGKTPVVSTTMIPVTTKKENFYLPLVLKARITVDDLTSWLTKHGSNARVSENLQRMQGFKYLMNGGAVEERGHLLAAMLGGPLEPYNFFPQVIRHDCDHDSRWHDLEMEVANFVKIGSGQFVDWQAALTYSGNIYSDVNSRRPTAVALSVTFFESDGTPIKYSKFPKDMYFSNDPNFNCDLKTTQQQ